MNLVLALDNKTSDELEHLSPHKSMYNLNKPRSLSDNARIPKPVASTISHWIHSPPKISNDATKAAFLASIAD